ncbi:MAG: BatA domain-containing protein, partial [Bacteroidaceae bacterium]
MIFANIEYFFLLLLLIPYVLWYFMSRRKREPSMHIFDTNAFRYVRKGWKIHLIHVPFLLRILTFVMIVCVLARPQTNNSWKNTETEGIDIMLAIDVSTSMLAEDLKPNRIEALQKVVTEFISGR